MAETATAARWKSCVVSLAKWRVAENDTTRCHNANFTTSTWNTNALKSTVIAISPTAVCGLCVATGWVAGRRTPRHVQ